MQRSPANDNQTFAWCNRLEFQLRAMLAEAERTAKHKSVEYLRDTLLGFRLERPGLSQHHETYALWLDVFRRMMKYKVC